MDFPGGSEDCLPQLKLLSVGVFVAALVALTLPPVPAITLVAVALLLGLVVINEHADWYIAHPFAFLSLTLLMGFVGPLFDFLVLDQHEATWALLNKGREILVGGGFVVLVGVGALIYGYASALGTRLGGNVPTLSPRWDGDRAIRIAKVYAFIGLLAFAYVVVTAWGEDISAKRQFSTVYFRWFVKFLLFGGLLSFMTLLEYEKPLRSPLGYGTFAAIGLVFIFGIIVSSRTIILWNSILLLALYVQYRRINVTPLIGIGVVAMVLSSTMLALRSDSNSLVEYLLPIPLLESVFGADRGYITAMSHLVELIPQVMPFRYGATLIQWVVFPIPRAVWPGKPMLIGNQIAPIIYNANNGTPPGLIGELYWNFWLVGVLVGLFAVGVTLRALVNYRNRARNSPHAILLTTVVLLYAGRIPDVTTFIVNVSLWMVPLGAAAVLIGAEPSASLKETLEGAPRPVADSLVWQGVVGVVSLPTRLSQREGMNRVRKAVRRGRLWVKEVGESSKAVELLQRMNQAPHQEDHT